MATKKKTNWFTKFLVIIAVLCIGAGIVFSVLWCVPSIHDKIWTPETTTTTEDDTTTDDTTTDNTDETENDTEIEE